MARRRGAPKWKSVLRSEFTPYRWVSFKAGRIPRGHPLGEYERDSVLEQSSKITREKLQHALAVSFQVSLYDLQYGVPLGEPKCGIELPFRSRPRSEEVNVPQIPPDSRTPPRRLGDLRSQLPSTPNSIVNSPSPDPNVPLFSDDSAMIVSSEAPLQATPEPPERKPRSLSQEIVTATHGSQGFDAHVAPETPETSDEFRGSDPPEESLAAVEAAEPRLWECPLSRQSRSSDDGQSEAGDRNNKFRECLASESEPDLNEGEVKTGASIPPDSDVPPGISRNSNPQSPMKAGPSERSDSTSHPASESPHRGLLKKRTGESASSRSPRNVLASPKSRASKRRSPILDGSSSPKSTKLGLTTRVSEFRRPTLPENESSELSPHGLRDNVAVDDLCPDVKASPDASREVTPKRRKRGSPQRSSKRRRLPPTPGSIDFSEVPETEPSGSRTPKERLPKNESSELFSDSADSDSCIGDSLENFQQDVSRDQKEGRSPPVSPQPLHRRPASDSKVVSKVLQPGIESSRLLVEIPPQMQSEQKPQSLSPEILTAVPEGRFQRPAMCESTSAAFPEVKSSGLLVKTPEEMLHNTTSSQPERKSQSPSPEIITEVPVGRFQESAAPAVCESTLDASLRLQKYDSSASDHDSIKSCCSPEGGALSGEFPFTDNSQSRNPNQENDPSGSSRVAPVVCESAPASSPGLRESDFPTSIHDSVEGCRSSEEDTLRKECPSTDSSQLEVSDHGNDLSGSFRGPVAPVVCETTSAASPDLRESDFPASIHDLVDGFCSSEEDALRKESPSTDGSQKVSDYESVTPGSPIPDLSGTRADADPEFLLERSSRSHSSRAESTGSISGENSPETVASFLEILPPYRQDEKATPSVEDDRPIFASSSSSPDSSHGETALESLVSDTENPNDDDVSEFWLKSAREEIAESPNDFWSDRNADP